LPEINVTSRYLEKIMSRKKISQINKKKAKGQSNPIPWRYCVLTLICGLFLVTGFFLAARQHFSSIDYSIKNSTLRRQLSELEADKRRLILSKEIALSPAEIKRVARKIGFTETANKLADIPADIKSAVKPRAEKAAEKVKQAVSGKIEVIKKAVETPVREAIKTTKSHITKDKPDKSQTQISAK
jgi:hypothetical protein